MGFLRFLFSKVFLKNLLLSIVLVLVIIAAVFIGLRIYTNHGKSLNVPDLKGMNHLQIKRVIKNSSLRYEIIDSIFTDSVPMGTLWEQIPKAGSKVKKERKIFLIMNASTRKTIAMPDVRDLSMRQAKTVLESAGLKQGDIIYVPSEFKNLVVDQHFEGVEIEPGDPVVVGSKIDLLVSSGLSSEMTIVPDFKGQYFIDVKYILETIGLNMGAIVNADEELAEPQLTDSLYIFDQKPQSESSVNIGSSVALWLTSDTLKLMPDTIQDSIIYE